MESKLELIFSHFKIFSLISSSFLKVSFLVSSFLLLFHFQTSFEGMGFKHTE